MRLLITSSRMPFARDAMSDGITWDGQPIPGLPPDDAAYLAELTGEPQG
jgi:hypothetical protein